jgi:NADH pyrophosphatase NudC (nudix superfamily)
MMTHPLEQFHFCPVCGSSQWEINNCKSKHCLHCGFVYYANAYASVAAFMHNDQGDLLVCLRKKNPAAGTLEMPGGFVDIGETAEEAVVREIREELGLTVIQSAYLFSLPNE